MSSAPSALVVSVRFLDRAVHGRADGGRQEFPPSPLRVFQSLVAAAGRQGAGRLPAAAQAALRWLERQRAPVIVAPASVALAGYRLSVPNNALDIVMRAASRGAPLTGDNSPATHRTMKSVRPTWLLDGEAVHYVWTPAEPPGAHTAQLARVAAGVVALGWGIDLAVGTAGELTPAEVRELSGERWLPGAAEGMPLRVPVEGTLDALLERYRRFIDRVAGDAFAPPPPLAEYARATYGREGDPAPRAFAAFSLVAADGSRFASFDAAQRGLTVAAMARHAARAAATRAGWPEAHVNSVVLGHGVGPGPGPTPAGPRRLAYLPLPSVERRQGLSRPYVGRIRRLLVGCFAPQAEADVTWAARALSGEPLLREETGSMAALLSLLPRSDSVVRAYTRPAHTWATVTPVVLPGYDDPAHYRRRLQRGVPASEQRELLQRLHERIDALLRKAIVQSGFPSALADRAVVDWNVTGFWPGVRHVEAYGVPAHLRRFPRLHVRVLWRDAHDRPLAVAGPVCIGGGRFFGIGLLAAVD